MTRFQGVVIAAAVVLLATTIGCGLSGSEGYRVSGKVTYGGQPLPSGSIQFEPDSSAGNRGLCATAMITDGVYTTTTGSVSGGKYVVRIYPPEMFSGADLSKVIRFPTHQTTIDLPQANA